MKYQILYIITFFFTVQFSNSQNSNGYKILIEEGSSLYEQQKYTLALGKYLLAFKIKENNPGDLYNAACYASLSGQPNMALNLLNKAHANGYYDVDHLKKDCDLYALHSFPEWKTLINTLNEEKSKENTDDEIFYKMFIKNIDADKAYDLFCTSDYKSNTIKTDFDSNRIFIYNLLKDNNITVANITRTEFSSLTTTENSLSHNEYKYSFYVLPLVFGVQINKLLMQETGNKVSSEYITIGNNSLLNKLKVEKLNLSDTSSNIKAELDKFITSTDTCHFYYGLFNGEKKVAGISSAVSNKYKITKIFNDLIHVPIENLPNLDCSKNFGYISFFKENFEFIDRHNMPDLPAQQTFEFVFFEKTDIMLVSIDGKYGFYRMKNSNKIKDFLTDKNNTLM
ncbi:hypothetical protein L1276_002893 [Flavobacterium sp. HSC-32F16]|uniref:TPR end-of-group domain-containing protein n=1 Tax=Flavobacterium sp. HSC-32F16 TaxID=2910964 RepID=UPI0020A5EEF1|nr:hypothetical protein [Flavobacterium sp. HSC-32F16]MCP2027733.1 hypothetical protein [Flavobacterium sp. HSC-32F16]